MARARSSVAIETRSKSDRRRAQKKNGRANTGVPGRVWEQEAHPDREQPGQPADYRQPEPDPGQGERGNAERDREREQRQDHAELRHVELRGEPGLDLPERSEQVRQSQLHGEQRQDSGLRPRAAVRSVPVKLATPV